MTAALPAFLVEAFFYLSILFDAPREWFARMAQRRIQALVLWMSALLPYLIFSFNTKTFQTRAFLVLAILCLAVSYWHVVVPRRLIYDVGFLIVVTAPIALRSFKRIYISPDPHFHSDLLGHLMLIRLAVAALLIFREWKPGPVGLWPRWNEWRSGALHYLAAIVPLAALGLSLQAMHFAPAQGPWWRILGIAIGTFFGIFWVVAFSEELLFRGVVARALLDRWRSPVTAVLLSALLFGCAHLGFRHFPDWQWVLITIVLGIACGSAYLRTGTIRAPMVTHALVVTTWRLLFR